MNENLYNSLKHTHYTHTIIAKKQQQQRETLMQYFLCWVLFLSLLRRKKKEYKRLKKAHTSHRKCIKYSSMQSFSNQLYILQRNLCMPCACSCFPYLFLVSFTCRELCVCVEFTLSMSVSAMASDNYVLSLSYCVFCKYSFGCDSTRQESKCVSISRKIILQLESFAVADPTGHENNNDLRNTFDRVDRKVLFASVRSSTQRLFLCQSAKLNCPLNSFSFRSDKVVNLYIVHKFFI